MAHRVYLGLGANLGERRATLEKAIALIDERVGHVERCSSFYETEPWGYASEFPFLNAVLLAVTQLSPQQVLQTTQQIERELGKCGRHHTDRGDSNHTAMYKDRPIDIDILLYDDVYIDEPGLHIPHPHMKERDFVMLPLKEITEY